MSYLDNFMVAIMKEIDMKPDLIPLQIVPDGSKKILGGDESQPNEGRHFNPNMSLESRP